ncbi:hypothetical protein B0H11DRAFT_2193507 [Mycena galericulata]|nr:hypothetical protein B0H11DRAFT_2193507 [Mycena galericulata]
MVDNNFQTLGAVNGALERQDLRIGWARAASNAEWSRDRAVQADGRSRAHVTRVIRSCVMLAVALVFVPAGLIPQHPNLVHDAEHVLDIVSDDELEDSKKITEENTEKLWQSSAGMAWGRGRRLRAWAGRGAGSYVTPGPAGTNKNATASITQLRITLVTWARLLPSACTAPLGITRSSCPPNSQILFKYSFSAVNNQIKSL